MMNKYPTIYDEYFLEELIELAERESQRACDIKKIIQPEDVFSYFLFKVETILYLPPFAINREQAIEWAHESQTFEQFYQKLIQHGLDFHKKYPPRTSHETNQTTT